MSIPKYGTGMTNYYEAQVTAIPGGEWRVLALALDALCLSHRVALVKIDAEDHEAFVLAGMRQLLARDRPVLIVETGSREVAEDLAARGYAAEKLPGSPNILFRPTA